MRHSGKIDIAEISAISQKFLDGHIGNKISRIYIIHHIHVYSLDHAQIPNLRDLEHLCLHGVFFFMAHNLNQLSILRHIIKIFSLQGTNR